MGKKLISALNRKNDRKLYNKRKMSKIASDNATAKTLLTREQYYRDSGKQPKYRLFPKKGKKGYNSNSFTRGLLNASGFYTPDMGGFAGFFIPGWDKPLPKKYFGV